MHSSTLIEPFDNQIALMEQTRQLFAPLIENALITAHPISEL
jgi:hypothetical protein